MPITTKTQTISLGNLQKSSVTDFSFEITNEGIQTVHLTVSAPCGCTKPVLTKNTLLPGESQKVKGTFRAGTSTGALVNKSASVHTQLSETLTVKLEGYVI